MKRINLLFITFLLIFKINNPRSIHRPINPGIGYIKVNWANDKDNVYFLRDSHLREFPIFKVFNEKYFQSKLLPEKIKYKNEEKFIKGSEIEKIIDNLFKEIKEKKRNYTNFTVLKKTDFNPITQCGLIVLKFNDYPFVLKLFNETPKSFANPYSKAFIERALFYIGGINRHITGLTRLPNIDIINNKIKDDPYWSKRITIPRKWLWYPKNLNWLEVTGYNLGDKKEQKILIPATYALICDEIKSNESSWPYRYEYLNLCSYLNYVQDALPSNFKIDLDGKIGLIDTEHFATIVGLDEPLKPFTKYMSWYLKLAGKYMRENFVSPKSYRRQRQRSVKKSYPLFND